MVFSLIWLLFVCVRRPPKRGATANSGSEGGDKVSPAHNAQA